MERRRFTAAGGGRGTPIWMAPMRVARSMGSSWSPLLRLHPPSVPGSSCLFSLRPLATHRDMHGVELFFQPNVLVTCAVVSTVTSTTFVVANVFGLKIRRAVDDRLLVWASR